MAGTPCHGVPHSRTALVTAVPSCNSGLAQLDSLLLQAAEPKKAPRSRKGRRAAVVEAEAADVHAEEIEIIDDDEEGADSGASQVPPPCSCCHPHCTTALKSSL